MKLLFENWREYIKEEKESFKRISASPWNNAAAKQEWGEEIEAAYKKGDEYIDQRWPGLSKKLIEENYPFLLNAEDFAAAIAAAPIKNLSFSEMKNIDNHAQVYDIIEMYEKNKTSEEVHDEIYKFFTGMQTDPGIKGKKYPKETSYQKWVDYFAEKDIIDKPPIVLELLNGRLAHVGGQTRQAGALTNQKIIPYVVLSPTQGEQNETPT